MNKKFVNFFIFCVLVLFLVLSCSTMGFADSDITRDEADYALHFALDSSCSKAFSKLKTQLTQQDYIPNEYFRLKENLSIPGLATLKNNLTTYYADYISENILPVEKYVKDVSKTLNFRNPVALVQESDRSASEQLIRQCKTGIKKKFAEIMQNADNSSFYACINQYNSYVNLYNLQHGTKNDTYNKISINPYIAEKLADLFFELLQSSEEYFRTTPNPYADGIVGKIFNIN